jgi:predicted nucleotidyltransferase
MTFWWQRLLNRKAPEKDLAALAGSLRALLGDRLESVLVFGSLASGEFHSGHSDVNVLVVAELSLNTLDQLGPALRPWLRKGHTAPVLVPPGDLPGFARAFPIEFLDMQDHHRVVFGKNPLTGLSVDHKHLHAQCEHDLALAQLKLRQGIAAAAGDDQKVRRVLLDSLPSVLALLRAVVRLEGDGAGLDKVTVTRRLAERLGFDILILRELDEWHARRATDNLRDMAGRYLDLIDAVLRHLRKK